jgi:hypothetical protein
MVEIGVQSGGSTIMWPDYFGEKIRYHGLDINPNCKQFERLPQVRIHICDQSKEDQLRALFEVIPRPDMILDDGGHMMHQQITSFKVLWPWLKMGGVYCCEDTHTSYWKDYNGGFGRTGTFVEFAKVLVDVLHFNHLEIPVNFANFGIDNANEIFRTLKTITIANSMFCFEKGDVPEWKRMNSGDYSIPY